MKYEYKLWWDEHKHDVIAGIIMSSMIIGFIIYLIVAYLKGWELRWG
jgi:preprotein translocase subunit Sss1